VRRLCGAALLAVLLGCGARTALGVDDAFAESDGGPIDSAVPSDTSIDTFVTDTFLPDVPVNDTACNNDLDCEDFIDCTVDSCDVTLGRCRNIPVDARCDDGVFCNGDERCEPSRGCFTVPRSCDDPIGCTVDRCVESERACRHEPDDALCPISHGCDAVLGCQARAIAHTRSSLYEVRLPSGIVHEIGPTTGTLTDVALHPDGTLYGVRFDGLCIVDLTTGGCGSVTRLAGEPVGLDAAPDGRLYGAAGPNVYLIDRVTGATTNVARFPGTTQASGDLAFLEGRLLGTATGTPDDVLVEFNLATATGRVLGRTGFRCIWGLAAYASRLYGLTCEGRVLLIDSTTGRGTELSRVAAEFWGATAR
jgi:hypothetical protein